MNEKVTKEELEKEITEIKENWPAHSLPPGLLLRLEELEEQLIQLQEGHTGELNASA